MCACWNFGDGSLLRAPARNRVQISRNYCLSCPIRSNVCRCADDGLDEREGRLIMEQMCDALFIKWWMRSDAIPNTNFINGSLNGNKLWICQFNECRKRSRRERRSLTLTFRDAMAAVVESPPLHATRGSIMCHEVNVAPKERHERSLFVSIILIRFGPIRTAISAMHAENELTPKIESRKYPFSWRN